MRAFKRDLKTIRKYCRLRKLPKRSAIRAFEAAPEEVRKVYRQEMADFFDKIKKEQSIPTAI